MKKQYLAFFSLLIILAFILYMIYDTVTPDRNNESPEAAAEEPLPPDQWVVSAEMLSAEGSLTSVAVSEKGNIFLGGDSYISAYDPALNKIWGIKTPARISALCVHGDTLFAAADQLIMLFDADGKTIGEWGPFEDNAIITSLASNRSYVAFADAGNRTVFVLTSDGRVKSMIGQSGDEFIIPSPYFDVALGRDNKLYISNPGKRRIETRTIDGDLVSFFGSPGLSPDAFCGCCNPSHFTLIPDGFLTTEKGINRIKILNSQGSFQEFVSSDENFVASIPLDISTADGQTVYAANPADSKLYVFKRK